MRVSRKVAGLVAAGVVVGAWVLVVPVAFASLAAGSGSGGGDSVVTTAQSAGSSFWTGTTIGIIVGVAVAVVLGLVVLLTRSRRRPLAVAGGSVEGVAAGSGDASSRMATPESGSEESRKAA